MYFGISVISSTWYVRRQHLEHSLRMSNPLGPIGARMPKFKSSSVNLNIMAGFLGSEGINWPPPPSTTDFWSSSSPSSQISMFGPWKSSKFSRPSRLRRTTFELERWNRSQDKMRLFTSELPNTTSTSDCRKIAGICSLDSQPINFTWSCKFIGIVKTFLLHYFTPLRGRGQ